MRPSPSNPTSPAPRLSFTDDAGSHGSVPSFISDLPAFPAVFDGTGGGEAAGLTGTPGNGGGVAGGESGGGGQSQAGETVPGFSSTSVGGRGAPFSCRALEQGAGGCASAAEAVGANGDAGRSTTDGSIDAHVSLLSSLQKGGSGDESAGIPGMVPGGVGALFECPGGDSAGAWASLGGGGGGIDTASVGAQVSAAASGERRGGGGSPDGSKAVNRLPFGACRGDATTGQVRALYDKSLAGDRRGGKTSEVREPQINITT